MKAASFYTSIAVTLTTFILLTIAAVYHDKQPKYDPSTHLEGQYLLELYVGGIVIPMVLYQDYLWAFTECNARREYVLAASSKALKEAGAKVFCARFYPEEL